MRGLGSILLVLFLIVGVSFWLGFAMGSTNVEWKFPSFFQATFEDEIRIVTKQAFLRGYYSRMSEEEEDKLKKESFDWNNQTTYLNDFGN